MNLYTFRLNYYFCTTYVPIYYVGTKLHLIKKIMYLKGNFTTDMY